MTVAEMPAAADQDTDARAYSTVETGNLVMESSPRTMTLSSTAQEPPPPVVLRFQLPSEPAELQRLMHFSSVHCNVVDAFGALPRD